MNTHFDSNPKAAEFREKRHLSSSFKRPLKLAEAEALAQQCQQLFRRLKAVQKPGRLLRLPHLQGELNVHLQGNSHEGRLVVTRGQDLHVEVNFSQRGITLFESRCEGFGAFRVDNAAVLNTRYAQGSAAYRETPNISWLVETLPSS